MALRLWRRPAAHGGGEAGADQFGLVDHEEPLQGGQERAPLSYSVWECKPYIRRIQRERELCAPMAQRFVLVEDPEGTARCAGSGARHGAGGEGAEKSAPRELRSRDSRMRAASSPSLIERGHKLVSNELWHRAPGGRRCLSLAGYVAGTGTRDRAGAAGGH